MFVFDVNGGKEVKVGKPTWPHVLNLHFTRRHALNFLVDLANQLQHENNQNISIGIVGKMSEEEDV